MSIYIDLFWSTIYIELKRHVLLVGEQNDGERIIDTTVSFRRICCNATNLITRPINCG